MTKDDFWALIAQAKEQCGQDLDASADWLEARLMEMGPEAARSFDSILHGYSALADKFGLWTAANLMLDGCTDDGFIDFLGWLIAQGKDVYMAALRDPDTLAEVPLYGDGCFESLAYIGDSAYEKLTGRSAYDSLDLPAYEGLKQELAKEIVYGEGIDYPYKWSEAVAYLPALCGKYLTAEEIQRRIQIRDDTWNPTSLEVRRARATAKKGKKLGGDAR